MSFATNCLQGNQRHAHVEPPLSPPYEVGFLLSDTIKAREEVLHMMETKRCAYCKALRLESLMLFKIHGLHFCNRGHYREHIRETQQRAQMDLFQASQKQPLPKAEPIKPMLNDNHPAYCFCRDCRPD